MDISKLTPCERKFLAWANSGVCLSKDTVTGEQWQIFAAMVHAGMVDYAFNDATNSIRFVETKLGAAACREIWLNPANIAAAKLRVSRYENEALF